MKKRLIAITLSIVTSIALCACGSSGSSYKATADAAAPVGAYEESAAYNDYGSSESYDYDSDTMTMYETEGEASVNTKTTENATTSNRKLIRTVDLNVETKEFDSLMNSLTSEISSLGGYIENMSGNYGSIYSTYRTSKSANIVARVPADKLDGFINSIGEKSNITYRSESVSDVTLEYVDMESHKRMLQEEQDRLLEFLEEADTVEEIISLEDRLTSVKYQIDSMESQIRTYDNKVDYSTVTIEVTEVVDYTEIVEVPELTPVQRMKEGFMNSLSKIGIGFREFAIWFVIHLPYIVLWAIVAAIGFVIVKFILKKNDQKMAALKAKREEEARKKAEAGETKSEDSLYVKRPDSK